ncbi:MAG: hypothetical protein AAF682_24040 [Planctomycetota bacterium]
MQVLLSLGACLALAGPVAAHGATYQPPPSTGGGGIKTPLPSPTQPPTYGGSPVANPGTPGAPAPGTLAGTFVTGLDRTRWTWWWEFHREPYLDLKRHILAGDPTSGEGRFLGRGDGSSPDLLAPTPARIRAEVLPALFEVLAEERQPDLLSSTLIAAARVGDDLDEADQRAVADRVRPFLRDDTHEVAEAAVLALGILGHEPSAPLLSALLADGSYGRSLLGKQRVPTRVRAFAAYSLGLLGGESEREDVRRYAVHELARFTTPDRKLQLAELEAACILALGLVPLGADAPLPEGETAPPAAGLRAQVAFLEELLLDRRRADLVRAQVPLSLARLAASAGDNVEVVSQVRRTLLARLAPMRREPLGVVQSSVVGLGLVADNDTDPGDVAVRAALVGIDSDHADVGTRAFARIALARIGARNGSGEPIGTDDVRRFLLREVSRGSTRERPWAALALGVLERERARAGRMPDAGVARALRDALDGARTPDEVGALAIATGLLRDPEAEEPLQVQLGRIREDEARGQVALALGMIGARTSAARLRALVDGSVYRPLLLREAATGLALLGEKETVARLVRLLGEARALSSQAALARALGRVGDARSLEPLAAMVADRELTDRARAFAAVALGLVGDLDPLPWHVPLSVHGNHLAAPATLYDDRGFGVLNLL